MYLLRGLYSADAFRLPKLRRGAGPAAACQEGSRTIVGRVLRLPVPRSAYPVTQLNIPLAFVATGLRPVRIATWLHRYRLTR